MNLTLRPMRYPELYERHKASIRNTWTVAEVDFSPVTRRICTDGCCRPSSI